MAVIYCGIFMTFPLLYFEVWLVKSGSLAVLTTPKFGLFLAFFIYYFLFVKKKGMECWQFRIMLIMANSHLLFKHVTL